MSPSQVASQLVAAFYLDCAFPKRQPQPAAEPSLLPLEALVTSRLEAAKVALSPSQLAASVSPLALGSLSFALSGPALAEALVWRQASQLPAVPPPQAASHSAAAFYRGCVSLERSSQQQAPPSAAPSAKGAMLAQSCPAQAQFDWARPALWPAAASGRDCARFVSLPRT